jgi:hypothetical protein
MPGKIFINYRRDDDAGFTQALYLRLEDAFSSDDVFMDVEGHIHPGDDFVEVIGSQVAAADVVLVVIGPRWSEIMARRADHPDDFVGLEIKAAFDQGKRIIPILVGGALMPRADLLPEVIRPLAHRNAVGLRPERFKADCQGLITALRDQLAQSEKERAARTEAERRAAEAERHKVEAEEAARIVAAEQRARSQAVSGLTPEEVRKAEELANWDFIKDRKQSQALRDHLARFPGGVTTLYAQSKLEELVWGDLGAAPGLQTVEAFLDEFPKGEKAEEAGRRIADLKKEAAAAEEAERLRLQEVSAWSDVAASTNIADIEAFLRDWPEGHHANVARQRIAELKHARWQQFFGLLYGAGLSGGLGLLAAIIGILTNQLVAADVLSFMPQLARFVFHGISLGIMVCLAALLFNVREPIAFAVLTAGCIAAFLFENLAWRTMGQAAPALAAAKSMIFALFAAAASPTFRHWLPIVTLVMGGLIAGQLELSFGYPLKSFIWESQLVCLTMFFFWRGSKSRRSVRVVTT